MLDMLSRLGEQVLPKAVNGPGGTDGLIGPIRSPQQAPRCGGTAAIDNRARHFCDPVHSLHAGH